MKINSQNAVTPVIPFPSRRGRPRRALSYQHSAIARGSENISGFAFIYGDVTQNLDGYLCLATSRQDREFCWTWGGTGGAGSTDAEEEGWLSRDMALAMLDMLRTKLPAMAPGSALCAESLLDRLYQLVEVSARPMLSTVKEVQS